MRRKRRGEMEVSEKEFTRGVVAELACEEFRARISALESESAQYREAAEKAAVEVERLRKHADFYLNRCNLLAKNQHRMRDPERTLVCDVLANGQLLPDPDGKRYGSAALAAGKG
jgi:predicted nuclease with TOPRIM domain